MEPVQWSCLFLAIISLQFLIGNIFRVLKKLRFTWKINMITNFEMNEKDKAKVCVQSIELIFYYAMHKVFTIIQNYYTCDDPEIINNVKCMSW